MAISFGLVVVFPILLVMTMGLILNALILRAHRWPEPKEDRE
jgi:hypothetical protein